MYLDELIYKWISEYEPVTNQLAVYSTKAAIFYQNAPDDLQVGWDQIIQYPRIIYTTDMQANLERKSAGTMKLSLICDEAGTDPGEIEPLIRACLKDLIIKPDDDSPYCFSWARTNAIETHKKESSTDTGLIGIEIRFDILEYPSQETTDPDPVLALNRFIKETIPEAFVLGHDQMNHFRIADAKAPVFYCRLEKVEKNRETNTVTWMDGKIAVHVLCSAQDSRLKLIMSLANSLSLSGEIIMLDKSPMLIKQLQVNNKTDYLKKGQLFVTVNYGLLKYRSKPHMISEVNIDFA